MGVENQQKENASSSHYLFNRCRQPAHRSAWKRRCGVTYVVRGRRFSRRSFRSLYRTCKASAQPMDVEPSFAMASTKNALFRQVWALFPFVFPARVTALEAATAIKVRSSQATSAEL